MSEISPIRWKGSHLELLDQRLLPQQEVWIALHTVQEVADAITDMVVRGAPAIGVTAAYGVVLSARHQQQHDAGSWRTGFDADMQMLAQARPTAVNLGWAISHMQQLVEQGADLDALEAAAIRVHEEDVAACKAMGDYGASLIHEKTSIITHCNAGALATAGYGTALGVIRSVNRDGHLLMSYADETRPWLQGARLTAWELAQDNVPVTLISDSAASYLMKNRQIGWVVVGSDRIAANGDVANKIGTYQLAITARHHGVKFMVAAPTTTIDMQAATGDDIPIEERSQDEVLSVFGNRIAADVPAWNPAFDVTPASLVDVIVTEKGVIESPDREKIAAHMRQGE
ncbi:MAG: S-methyl-5-thioribose-1-phosphate isomerase [Gammaproteobacteria bacterium]|nr:S-methyl-5-thioribose-1-phosphate isomerase [Gammaproteobacteria bacterium]